MKLYIYIIGIFLGIFSCGYASSQSEVKQMEFCSQASQDEFAYALLYTLLGKEDAGYYLEIGAGHPKINNNSYCLEKNLGWQGISMDISNAHDWYSNRNNLLLVENAVVSDYDTILKYAPQSIDYLSLDIDGNYDTVLDRLPTDDHIFKVITIEHDFYRFGEHYRAKERQILTSRGYYLLCPDVSCIGLTFEDWWIHPSAFPPAVFCALISLDLEAKDHKELLQIIQTAMPSLLKKMPK